MRRWLFALIPVIARAAPPPAPITWADWVGDWDGKLKWSGCALEGPSAATFAIDATDGVMAIDLSGAGSAFSRMTLVEDGPGWTAQQADVTLHVTRAKAGIDVALDLLSGCTMRTTTQRVSTGIIACDHLDAWSRIEARCTRLGRPPLENPARLVRQHETWTKARGDERGKLGAQCEARAAKVEAELVDVGCAPNPDPTIGKRGVACQALRQSAAKLTRCGNISSGVSSVLEAKAIELVAAAQTADDATLPAVEAQCTHLREDIVSIGQKFGCPP